MDNKDVRVRIANLDDAEAIQKIYAPYVEETPITFEIDTPTVEDIRDRIEEVEKTYPFLVAELDHVIVGYAYATEFKGRAAYDHSVEVSIYVDREQKRNGIGTKLYYVLEDFLHDMGYTNANACISVSPRMTDAVQRTESTRFHRKSGYNLVGKFHKVGYKFGKWYDIVWMEKKIGDHSTEPSPIVNFPEWRKEKDI